MAPETALQPIRVQWEPSYGVGHERIDAEHRQLLDACNRLADLLAGVVPGEHPRAADAPFDQAWDGLKALLRTHRDSEATLLAERGFPDLDDHRFEFDEFEHLAGEVATTDHFDRLELQRFVALWCIGHVASAARQQRAFLSRRPVTPQLR